MPARENHAPKQGSRCIRLTLSRVLDSAMLEALSDRQIDAMRSRKGEAPVIFVRGVEPATDVRDTTIGSAVMRQSLNVMGVHQLSSTHGELQVC